MRTLSDLPGPRRLPLAGNAHKIRAPSLHLTVERWADWYGPLYRFDIGRRPIVAVGRPATMKAVLRGRPEAFRRWEEIQEVLGEANSNGVFAAEGEDWRRQRRLAVTALNANHLARYFDVIRIANERLGARLADAAASGKPYDLAGSFASYAVDVTAALAFGIDIERLDRRERLNADAAEVFSGIARRISSPIPYWRHVRLPADRRFDRSVTALESAVQEFIAEARARIGRRPELEAEPENFIEGMIAQQNADGRHDERELFGNVMTMLLAGEDTTSHTLCWAVWLLSRHPHAQAQVADEADATLGDAAVVADRATADELTFTEGVVREALRVKPVAPLIFLQAVGEQAVEDVTLPAGTQLVLHGRHAAMRPDNFARPERFEPERWLERGGQARESDAYVPFGGGPRFCPGRNLALLEAKAALATVARSYHITLDPASRPVTEKFGFTMAPTHMRVLVRHRD